MKQSRAVIILAVVLAAAGSILATALTERALAGRNSSGTYTLPNSNPVVTGTSISSTWANNTMSDIGTEITNSLDRGGRGAMTAALQHYAGTVSNPGMCFAAETNSGIYRAASHDVRMAINGVDAQKWTATGATVPGNFSVGTTSAGGNSGVLNVAQRIQPIGPAPQDASYPLGNDLWLMARGTADVRLMTWSYNFSSTTTVTAGSNRTITVGSPRLCPSSATLDTDCATPSGTTTGNLCLPGAGCSLVVEPDTANAETVAGLNGITAANWSITNGTTLVVTFAKAHTQPFVIRQIGSVFLDARALSINPLDVSDRPLAIQDKNNSPIAYLPNDSSGTFPSSAIQVGAVITGLNGTDNVVFRNRDSSGCVQFDNAANTATLFDFCENGGAPFLSLSNGTNNGFVLTAASDVARMYGGGTSSGLIFYGNQGGTGTNGSFKIRNNSTDDTEYFNVNTATGTTTTNAISNTGLISTASLTTGLLSLTSTGNIGAVSIASGGGTATATVKSGCKPVCSLATASGSSVSCQTSGTVLTVVAGSSGLGTQTINYICL